MVVNAMEGEPAAHKDQTLIGANPHLVLDGAEFLASIDRRQARSPSASRATIQRRSTT